MFATHGPIPGRNRPSTPASTTRMAFCPEKSMSRRREWPSATCPSSCATTEASSAALTSPASYFRRNPRVRKMRPSGAAIPLIGSTSWTFTAIRSTSSTSAMGRSTSSIPGSRSGVDVSSICRFSRHAEKSHSTRP